MSGWNSFSHANTTEANASLISVMSMSPIESPERSKILRVAGIGAVSMNRGSSPAREKLTNRARGVRPNAAAFSSLMINNAAAPSVICDEFPAVTFPPLSASMNDGLSEASFSRVVSRRPSSTVIILPSKSIIGRICDSKRPSAVARWAYC